jgi:hypothetical protein
MKKVVLTLSVLILVVVLLGADIRRKDSTPIASQPQKKSNCYGYTIIEFGKGIDCNGDTVKLTKVNGGQQRWVDSQVVTAANLK